jgi:hypothetical protein
MHLVRIEYQKQNWEKGIKTEGIFMYIFYFRESWVPRNGGATLHAQFDNTTTNFVSSNHDPDIGDSRWFNINVGVQ